MSNPRMSNEIVPKMSNEKNSLIPKMSKREKKKIAIKETIENEILIENMFYLFFLILAKQNYNLFVFIRILSLFS